MSRIGFAIALAVAATACPATAQIRAATDSVNGHRFISTPIAIELDWVGGGIYYQVCNHSSAVSNFSWDGAGWGVNAWKPLDIGSCAQKRLYGPAIADKPGSGRVHFPGPLSQDIPTWLIDWEGEGALAGVFRIVSEIILPAEGPEDIVEFDQILLDLSYDGGGQAMIRIRSASLQEVIIALPSGAEESIRSDWMLEQKNDGFGFDELDNPEEALPDLSPELVDGTPFAISPDSPIYRVGALEEGGIRADLLLSRGEQLSGAIQVYGRRGEQTKIMDVVPVPTGEQ